MVWGNTFDYTDTSLWGKIDDDTLLATKAQATWPNEKHSAK